MSAASGASTPLATEEPDLQASAAYWYAAKMGLSVSEAKARLDLQDRLVDVADQVEAAIGPADDGAIWFDNTDGGGMKVCVVTNDPTPSGPGVDSAKAVLAAAALETSADFVAVCFSWAQLAAAQDALDTQVKDLIDDGRSQDRYRPVAQRGASRHRQQSDQLGERGAQHG